MIWGKILKLWYRGKYQKYFSKEWSDHWYYWKDFYSSLLFQHSFSVKFSHSLTHSHSSLSYNWIPPSYIFSWFKNSHHHQINFQFLIPQDFLILPDWVTLEGFRTTTNFLSFLFLSFHFRLKVMNMKCQVWRNEGRMRDRKKKRKWLEFLTWKFR